eukprot:1684099-Amphidinium_carterae.1
MGWAWAVYVCHRVSIGVVKSFGFKDEHLVVDGSCTLVDQNEDVVAVYVDNSPRCCERNTSGTLSTKPSKPKVLLRMRSVRLLLILSSSIGLASCKGKYVSVKRPYRQSPPSQRACYA